MFTTGGNYVESVLFHLQYHDFVTGTQWPKWIIIILKVLLSRYQPILDLI